MNGLGTYRLAVTNIDPHSISASLVKLVLTTNLYIVHRPEHAGHAMHTFFVDNFDALIAQIAGRGIDPVKREIYANGVRKTTYRDLDGNEIGLGGAPQ